MKVAILSNARPLEETEVFQRARAIVPVLARLNHSGEPFPAYVPDAAAWAETGGSLQFHALISFEQLYTNLRDSGVRRVIIDYDASAGRQRDRSAFLRIAGRLAAAGTAGDRVSVDLALAGDSACFSPLALGEWRSLMGLARRGGRLFTFSREAAERLHSHFRRPFEVIPMSTVVPRWHLEPQRARARLGFSDESRELLIGVIGQYRDLRQNLLMAGLKEALRISPGCRVLYLGQDGGRFKQRGVPVPFHDGGLPNWEGMAMRIRAMDLILRPAKEGAVVEDPCVLAGLCNGTPVVACGENESQDGDPKNVRPAGFTVVGRNALGDFLEAIERACDLALQPREAVRELRQTLEDYYERRFGVNTMIETLGLEH